MSSEPEPILTSETRFEEWQTLIHSAVYDGSQELAQSLDQQDQTTSYRSQFVIPTKRDLRSSTLKPETATTTSRPDDDDPCIYLCGNSLGLQPAKTRQYFEQYLQTWATKGVFGHFTPISDSNLPPWLHVDDDVQADMAAIVGALPYEVAVMQTLTANLHLMLAAFYKPDTKRYKIILEAKAFPSDHYAIESQLAFHGQDASKVMVLITPPSSDVDWIPTEHILKVIDEHADDTAVLLLPGVQFYTGQYFDIPRITSYAHSKGILVGWDLAHAAGNVPMYLHDWEVDFAVWCTYKYLNCGPGSIGACFVNERHFDRPRLEGWWGSNKTSRFAMTNVMERIKGASGFQLSNPSVADLTAVRASLDIYKQTSVEALRERSLRLTYYLDYLLTNSAFHGESEAYTIITPEDTKQRGAQLSIKLSKGLLDPIMSVLEERSIVVDERKPDVIRVAPAPLYNTFQDVWTFVDVLEQACLDIRSGKLSLKTDVGASADGEQSPPSIMVAGGADAKGWSGIK